MTSVVYRDDRGYLSGPRHSVCRTGRETVCACDQRGRFASHVGRKLRRNGIVVDALTRGRAASSLILSGAPAIIIEPVTEEQAYVARQAYAEFGKGRHTRS